MPCPALCPTALRILAITDLAAAFVPVRTSFGTAGTCTGPVELLERERRAQPTIWLDAGDLAPILPAMTRSRSAPILSATGTATGTPPRGRARTSGRSWQASRGVRSATSATREPRSTSPCPRRDRP